MDFLKHLMRGGSFGHFWAKQTTTTFWWPVDSEISLSDLPLEDNDLYFGVHPSKRSKGTKERTIVEDISAINCLYSDFDLKDFEGSKRVLAAHIKELKPQPSVIIDSGGGFHCYWLLDKPFILDSRLKTEVASDLQKQWVIYVKGDLAVHDLARIMRLPGTLNFKYEPPRETKLLREDLSRLYALTELQEVLPSTLEHRETKKIPNAAQPNTLSEQEIVDLIVASTEGPKFSKLFKGYSDDYASSSEADLAFCSILSFWTGGDYRKIDRIFKASDRNRAKWEREDYRHSTLIKAIQSTKSFYTDPNGLLTAGAHDEGNACCSYARVKNRAAYTEALGWLFYQSGHWESELAESYVEEEIVQTLRARRRAAVSAGDEAILRAAKPTRTHVTNAKTLLRRKVATPISSFDSSLDELNCTNGVLNLRTGDLSPHHYKKHFSYCLPVRYDEDADSKFWTDWLYETAGNRQDVVDFLQLALGYTISGHIREEVMFYIFGPARGGKGVFTETLIHMLGGRPLATEVDIDMFMSKTYNYGSVGFSLAELKAARFVSASESRENEWLNAKRVKRWTGGNPITAAHKYGRDFTYTPQFKIWLTSNYPPQMDADDKAAWSRLRIFKFPNSYLGREDRLLKGKMVSDDVLQGILAWCVQGSMKWYKLGSLGLKAPKVVLETTKSAQENVDFVSAWMDEHVQITNSVEDTVPTDVYYPEYKDWCIANGVSPKSLRSLNVSLREAGFEVGKLIRYGKHPKRCWVGVRVNGYGPGLTSLKVQEERSGERSGERSEEKEGA